MPLLKRVAPGDVARARPAAVEEATLQAARSIVDDVAGRGEQALREHAERLAMRFAPHRRAPVFLSAVEPSNHRALTRRVLLTERDGYTRVYTLPPCAARVRYVSVRACTRECTVQTLI